MGKESLANSQHEESENIHTNLSVLQNWRKVHVQKKDIAAGPQTWCQSGGRERLLGIQKINPLLKNK